MSKWIDWGRESDKYLRDRSWKCLASSVGCPEWTLRSTKRQQQRINRSIASESAQDTKEKIGRTNIRIPSASAFQSSTFFLSSSVAISRYIEKMGPDPSTKSDVPCGA